MEIIKAGSIEKLNGIITFTCPLCGCVFKANRTEYSINFRPLEGAGWYSIKCPCCKFTVTKERTQNGT